MPKRETKKISQEELYEKADKYLSVDGQVKSLSKEIAPLKEELKEQVNVSGNTNEESGHTTLILKSDGKKDIILTNQNRVSSSVSVHALDFLKKQGLAEEYIETVEVVRTDKVEEAAKAGKFTPEQLKELFSISETKAFTIKYDKK